MKQSYLGRFLLLLDSPRRISNKFQFPNDKSQTKIKMITGYFFCSLEIGFWNLFGIWSLLFGIC
jgi:hypothetical protein